MDSTTDSLPTDESPETLADPSYRRDLRDGLLLRWSTAADTERLAQFYGVVFRDHEADPPNQRVMAWARDMLSGRDPLIGPDGFALVEDTATGAVAAATCLLSEAWEYDGVRIPVGRPEIVGSLPEYRRRGLVREVFRLIHARSQAQGHLAEVITGIWWYYRQFGYEYAVGMPGALRIPFADLPAHLAAQSAQSAQSAQAAQASEAVSFTLRPATEADGAEVARLYDAERASALVSTAIDARYWRWAIAECDPEGDAFLRAFLIEDASGEVVGYLLTGMSAWNGALSVFALWLRPGLWLEALPPILRGLRSLAETAFASEPNGAPLTSLRFWLPEEHPAPIALRALLRPQVMQDLDNAYAWYVRVADLPALLRALAPALERRLAASPFAGYSGELALDFYRGGVRMLWRDGRLAEVADWQKPLWGEGSAGFPPGVFLQLLFGHRDLRELRHSFPDVWADGAAKSLLPILFPRRVSWALPLG